MKVDKVQLGDGREAYVLPDGYTACLVSVEDAESMADWRECAAVRMAPASDDGKVALFEFAEDLERITEPA